MYSGKKIRTAKEDLQELLNGLKVGDGPVYDSLTNYEITRVPNGFVYRHEYEGIVFVPDTDNLEQMLQDLKIKEKPIVKNAVVKTEPKGKIEK